MNESRLICTLCLGDEFDRLGEVTHPLQKEYAQRCGADFIVIREFTDRSLPPGLEKLQFIEFLSTFDRVLFIDTDILVVPGSFDLFEKVHPQEFGATLVYGPDQPHRKAAFGIETDMRVAMQTFGKSGWSGPYFNSGVMLFGKMHLEALVLARQRAKDWATAKERVFMDQTLINYCIWESQLPIKDLGYHFNHTPAFGMSNQRFKSAFVHYAGRQGHRKGSRLRQIKWDGFILQHPRLLDLAKRSPRLVSFFDRI